MKRMKNHIIPIFAAIALFALIMDAKTAVAAAEEGIQLCIKTLVPSLFPFFVISGFFCSVYAQMNLPFLKPVLRFCGIKEGTESLFIIGLLGGYPVGAKMIADAYREDRIPKEAARRMLGFCSNAGPAFVFGVIGTTFDRPLISWILLIILILSAIITGHILPNKDNQVSGRHNQQATTFIKTLEGSIRAMASVCGWVILFRVLLITAGRWFLWLLPRNFQVIITGITELSNGCIALKDIANDGARFMLAAALLSFGGFCVYLQTVSVTETLGTGYYFPGKILQSTVSLVLSGVAQFMLFDQNNRAPLAALVFPILFIAIMLAAQQILARKKTVAIPGYMMYNAKYKA